MRPVPIDAPRPGELILFQGSRELVCHRLMEVSGDALLARGDAAGAAGEWIGPDHVIGKLVEIRKQTVLIGFKVTLQSALLPSLLQWLRCFQRLKAYRILFRRLVASILSYHFGLAQGVLRYEWLELLEDNGLPVLPRSARPHLLVAKQGKDVVGRSVLAFRNSAWRRANLMSDFVLEAWAWSRTWAT